MVFQSWSEFYHIKFSHFSRLARGRIEEFIHIFLFGHQNGSLAIGHRLKEFQGQTPWAPESWAQNG